MDSSANPKIKSYKNGMLSSCRFCFRKQIFNSAHEFFFHQDVFLSWYILKRRGAVRISDSGFLFTGVQYRNRIIFVREVFFSFYQGCRESDSTFLFLSVSTFFFSPGFFFGSDFFFVRFFRTVFFTDDGSTSYFLKQQRLVKVEFELACLWSDILHMNLSCQIF